MGLQHGFPAFPGESPGAVSHMGAPAQALCSACLQPRLEQELRVRNWSCHAGSCWGIAATLYIHSPSILQ